jgi:hypothetical protein
LFFLCRKFQQNDGVILDRLGRSPGESCHDDEQLFGLDRLGLLEARDVGTIDISFGSTVSPRNRQRAIPQPSGASGRPSA